MTCDVSYLNTNEEVKWPGSFHDSRIFRESNLNQTLEHGDRILGIIYIYIYRDDIYIG